MILAQIEDGGLCTTQGGCGKMKTPLRQRGLKVRCYIKRRLAHFPPCKFQSEEVVRMWKKRIVAVLQILVYLAVLLYVMTIDVC